MKTISASALKSFMQQNDVLLIDVRQAIEYKSEHIDGACLIPVDEISEEKLPSKSRTIVLYCRSGKRSSLAYEKLSKQDPSLKLFSLDGGITAWQSAGFNLSRTDSRVIPIDRQVQLLVGSAILSGTLFGMIFSPTFYIIPGFLGAGLIFAGSTGWCGMAKVLAKMPWNK